MKEKYGEQCLFYDWNELSALKTYTQFILLLRFDLKSLVVVDGNDGHVWVEHLPDLPLSGQVPGPVDRNDLYPISGQYLPAGQREACWGGEQPLYRGVGQTGGHYNS